MSHDGKAVGGAMIHDTRDGDADERAMHPRLSSDDPLERAGAQYQIEVLQRHDALSLARRVHHAAMDEDWPHFDNLVKLSLRFTPDQDVIYENELERLCNDQFHKGHNEW